MKKLSYPVFIFLFISCYFFNCSGEKRDVNREVNPRKASQINEEKSKDIKEMPQEKIETEEILIVESGNPGIAEDRNDNQLKSRENDKRKVNGTPSKEGAKQKEAVKVTKDNPQPDTKEGDQAVDHQKWDELLQKYVSKAGKVDYKGLKAEKDKVDQYLDKLKSNPPGDDWSKEEKLAYWINLYNASTVSLILENYPLKSIMDLEKPFDKKFVEVEGKAYSLNQIENEIIRPSFNEPRIHFAVNCAAVSCPKLRNEAYKADKLEKQLEDQTNYFLTKSGENELDGNSVKISKIFDWYGEDFKEQGIISFINKYSNTKINDNADISFKEYDWALNNR